MHFSIPVLNFDNIDSQLALKKIKSKKSSRKPNAHFYEKIIDFEIKLASNFDRDSFEKLIDLYMVTF